MITGVAGAGKTTVGRLLSAQIGWPFYDAEDFHPQHNIQKMASGFPLSDHDRQPWLKRIRSKVHDTLSSRLHSVFAFPGLTRYHRTFVTNMDPRVRLVLLNGSYELIYSRLLTRTGHFFPPHLLSSQFALLEPPSDALLVNVSNSPQHIVNEICSAFGLDTHDDVV